jgi:hypothetical protein
MKTLQLPNLDQKAIKRKARELAPSYELYYPGKTWFVTTFGGNYFAFPPDLNGKMVDHPFLKDADGTAKKVPADGILRIKDRYGNIYSKKAKPTVHPIYGYPMGMALAIEDPDGKLEEESADKVVMFFTRKFGVGAIDPAMAIGITLLTGNYEEDVQIKKASQHMYTNSQKKWAEAERASRLEELDRWKKLHPNQTNYPAMTYGQRRAEEILLQAAETVAASSMRFVCPEGDFETDESSLFEKHIALRHPGSGYEVPKQVGRPKKVEKDPTVEAEELKSDAIS